MVHAIMRRTFSLLVALALLAPATAASAEPGKAAAVQDLDLSSVKVDHGRARAPKVGGGELGVTVDPALQAKVMRILEATKAPSGAIVMSDARTGRILAWASTGNEGDLVRQAHYPGASLFKVVTAATLLEERKVTPGESTCFSGGESRLKAADVEPGCHAGDQRTRFDHALGKSINGVFARLALQHLDEAQLATMATSLGPNDVPLFDLPADRSFVKIPADRLGFARAAAGFGDAKLSPLSALFMMQTIANKGERVRLHVTGDPASTPRVVSGRAVSKETAEKLVKMLEVTTTSGTSRKAFRAMEGRPNIAVAGKTGTLLSEKPRRLVSWFAGFAPAKNPEVVVSVLLANDEKWWRKANETARDVLDVYFAEKGHAPAGIAAPSARPSIAQTPPGAVRSVAEAHAPGSVPKRAR